MTRDDTITYLAFHLFARLTSGYAAYTRDPVKRGKFPWLGQPRVHAVT